MDLLAAVDPTKMQTHVTIPSPWSKEQKSNAHLRIPTLGLVPGFRNLVFLGEANHTNSQCILIKKHTCTESGRDFWVVFSRTTAELEIMHVTMRI